MKKVELVMLAFMGILIWILSQTLLKFSFLAISGVVIAIYLYWILKIREDKKVFKKALKVYKITLSSVLVICLVIVSNMIYKENQSTKMIKEENTEYVVVLGSKTEKGKVTKVLKNRLDKALEYYNLNNDIKIITTGGVTEPGYKSEAETMREYLCENGVEKEDIIVEDRARNTYENIKFTKEILKREDSNLKNIVIVTSDFHIARSLMIASELELDAKGLCSKTPSEVKINAMIREIMASIKDFVKCKIN